MKPIRVLSAAEQVARHLQQEIAGGALAGELPGIHRLAALLGVNHKTVAAALRLLRKDGILVSRGNGRRCGIEMRTEMPASSLRVGVLVHDPPDRGLGFMVEIIHELERAGHQAFFLPKSLNELGMDARRVARMLGRCDADAWLVLAGSKGVLESLAGGEKPTMALFGRRRGLAIANVGPDKPPVLAEATRVLLRLGHRRIVLIVRSVRRLPEPGASERAFLAELEAQGVKPGPYHLPEWDDTVDGLFSRLESLFRVTPPTALIVDEPSIFSAVQQFLANHGLKVPQDVSLICTDWDTSFEWSRPTIAHIRWDSEPVVRRIVQWAGNVSRGRKDLRQTLTPAEFVPGGTIGPARER